MTVDKALSAAPSNNMLMAIIERASAMPEFDLSRIEKLLELKERWDATEAKKAYTAAMVEFKKNPPQIYKNKAVSYGNTSYNHATHDEVVSKVGAALSAHGFTHEWRATQQENKITVTCILSHVGGHSEHVELSSINDGSGGKNSIQAIASANSYLQRYTLLAVTGLSTSEIPDDDGRTAASKAPPPEVNQDAWVVLQDAVHDGTGALADAWKSLSNETRKLIVEHYGERWNELKAAALAVKS